MDNSDALLQFPVHSEPDAPPQPGPAQSRTLQKDRLFIGNLHPAVDEYTLLQVFTKYGKVTKLDFLFHKSGPLKGKPRGYAFIQYANQDDASKALASANDKLLRGRKLAVTYANQAPLDMYSASAGNRPRKGMMESGRPTTLSMIKSTGKHAEQTSNKIAMLEAKLKQMEAAKASSSASTSTLPSHPSLPMKPPPTVPGAPSPSSAPGSSKPPKPTPSLPLRNLPEKPKPLLNLKSSTPTAGSTKSKGGLVGVKIVKSKSKDTRDKDKEKSTDAADGPPSSGAANTSDIVNSTSVSIPESR
ncbi:hypothetical protein VKT23_018214 [Stygiomarasmius scandens]|uniref:Probable RNA-binding protein 18 n=1 Tax=Marasmiellus scandens TaxID=2682957 RepID=A0ABR1IPW5_9AGAR